MVTCTMTWGLHSRLQHTQCFKQHKKLQHRPFVASAAASSFQQSVVSPSVLIRTHPDDTTGQPGQMLQLDYLGKHSHRLVVAYDGTNYSGWQLQPTAPTIQQAVEAALMTVMREDRTKLGVSAAGRTDAGVHARGQNVQFFTDHEPEPSKLPRRLNALLPPDIRVMSAHRTAPDFHVTITAQAKTYRYRIDTGEVQDPMTYRYRMHHRHELDIAAVKEAAPLFVGTHNFMQFSNHGTDTAKRNPIKTMRRVDMTEIEGGIMVEVEGEGFLYRQVRHMVGALLAIGGGRMTKDHLAAALTTGSQQLPGAGGLYRGWNVAPAKGLTLHEVHYPQQVDNPDLLLYPDYPHDEYGRLVYRLPGDAETE